MTLLAPDRAKRANHADTRRGPVAVASHDGSPEAAEVLAHAALRAGPSGQVVVVRVVAPDESWAGYAEAVNGVLRDVESTLPGGMSYEVRVVAGPEPEALREAVSRSDADLIILGAAERA